MQRGGHLLCHDVHIGIGQIHDAPHIADGTPGGHGAEGDDMGHMVIAVFAADIVEHLVAAGVAEIHIDIGHTDALGIQEALKIKAVLHGVDLGNIQAVGHHAARGAAAAGAHRDPGLLCVVHKVGHDQEIIGEAHFFDHIQLIIQLLAAFGPIGIFFGKAAAAQLPEVCLGIVARRQLEFRQVIFAEGEFHIAAFGDLSGIFDGLRMGGKQSGHLLRGAEVKILGLIAHPVGIFQGLPCLDAKKDVMAVGVLFPEIVGVVRHYQRNAGLFMQAQEPRVHCGLLPDTVVLEFQEEIVLPKDLPQFEGVFFCPRQIAAAQAAGDLAGQAGRQGDEALGVPAQQIEIDAGFDIKALREGTTDQEGEVPVPLLIFAQQHQMAGLGVEFMHFVKAAAAFRRHIDFAADDGLHALGLAGAVKVDHAVHHTVIGDGDGVLPHGFDQFRQITDAACAVQQAEFRMDM